MMDGLRKAGQSWFGRIVITILFGFLIFSFALWGIGDIFRGYGLKTVATVGKTDVDGNAARLFFRQAVGVDAGERLDQRGLAVVDVAGGGDDHAGDIGRRSAASWAAKPASSSRQRRSSTSSPSRMRPITGTGSARRAPA